MSDPIADSFELAAQSGVDINALVYERFFALAPAAADLMTHIDEHVQGRMLAEVFELLLIPSDELPDDMLAFETANHANSYAVEFKMYRSLLDAIAKVVEQLCGSDWTAELQEAWAERINGLERRISDHFPHR